MTALQQRLEQSLTWQASALELFKSGNTFTAVKLLKTLQKDKRFVDLLPQGKAGTSLLNAWIYEQARRGLLCRLNSQSETPPVWGAAVSCSREEGEPEKKGAGSSAADDSKTSRPQQLPTISVSDDARSGFTVEEVDRLIALLQQFKRTLLAAGPPS